MAAFLFPERKRKVMEKRKVLLYLLLSALLSACSGTYMTHYENLKLAFATPPDPTPSLDEINNSDADLALIKIGERSLARIALAYQENGINKWVSADNAMLVIMHGHIVKTHGFNNDLLYMSDTDKMPLYSGKLHLNSWERLVDWDQGEYGYSVTSVFSELPGVERIDILGKSFAVRVILEQATYADPEGQWRTGASWENRFWFDEQTGILLQSSQKLSPFSDRFDIQYISRAVRLMQ